MALQQGRAYTLPDFCRSSTLWEVVVLAELLALVLVLLPDEARDGFWSLLGLFSLYLQWIALTDAALLCLLRRPMQRLDGRLAAAIGLGIMALVTAGVSELSYHFYLSSQPTFVIGHGPFILRAVLVSLLFGAVVLRYFTVQQRWRRDVEAVQRARLEALQSRIQPHFLFNSLNTIASLIPGRPQQAEGLIEDLSELFRASLAGERPLHQLEDELELTRAYLNLEQQRLGERLRIAWQLAEVPRVLVPPLILQPLVENAVRHGIEPLPGGGELRVALRREPGALVLVVENPLGGDAPGNGNHMALANVQERLHAVFGNAAHLWKSDEGGMFRVELNLPIQEAP